MDRARKLATMALRIRRAAAAEDWRQVALLDREIGALLPQLAQLTRTSGWAAADLDALNMLRNVHDEVRRECALALERVGTHLAEHRDRKGGWIAYALNDSGGRV
jgi:hypothetical protein